MRVAGTPPSLLVLLPQERWYMLGPEATTDSQRPEPASRVQRSAAVLEYTSQWYSVGHVMQVHLSTRFLKATRQHSSTMYVLSLIHI